MAGFVRAVALDLDGTLTDSGALSQPAIREIDRLRDDGLVAVLVTGRIGSELDLAFPGLREHFDAVVAENGAVLQVDETENALAEPIEDVLEGAISELGISFRRGRVLLAADATDAETIVSAAGKLGLDCQVVRNRGAVMVLPAGVSKGTGLLAALDALGVSPHNAIAAGDAENDLALLHAAEVGVAVANAVPSLRQHADLVLDERDGEGIAALLAGPVLTGETVIRPARRRVTLGAFDDGTPATLPAWPTNVLVRGESGAGKSYLAGLLIEQWVTAGYTVLAIDMEGDHVALGRLRKTIVVSGRPSISELLSMLRQQSLSVILDLSGLGWQEKLDCVRVLAEVIEVERASRGRPHWIVVDEAHATLSEGGIASDLFRPADLGYCLVTYQPEQLCAEAVAAIDVTITARSGPDRAIDSRPRATLRELGSPERPFIVAMRRTPHVRHRHKYAAALLPEHRWFRFRSPDGHVIATARNVGEFLRCLSDVDDGVIEHHLLHGDFSRWLLGAMQDRNLAASIGAIERKVISRRAGDLLAARGRIREELANRYVRDRSVDQVLEGELRKTRND
jgi:hydroxymethylpyrimidine pyrophosphatase-like HAD family hydrolase